MPGFHSSDDDFLYEDQCEIFASTPEQENPLKRAATIITKWHNRIDKIMEERAELKRFQDSVIMEQQAEIKRVQDRFGHSKQHAPSVFSDRWVQLERPKLDLT